MLVVPGLEPKRRKPPRRITQVLNCPRITWVIAEVSLWRERERERDVMLTNIIKTSIMDEIVHAEHIETTDRIEYMMKH